MNLALFTILVNTSLCVLIWLIQLVVYPGFCYYSELEMKRWHSVYTGRVTFIVLPLMLSQLGMYAFSFFYDPSYFSMGMLALVATTWIVTFLVSVPLHNAINKRSNSKVERYKLIKTNWIRTLIWTLVLILSILFYGK